MTEDQSAFALAIDMLFSGDAQLYQIIALSLGVSLSAVSIGCLIGIPLGALLAAVPFRGRGAAITVLNAFMGLPPVVVGLMVYLALSRSGPFGILGLLYTPSAMIIAQSILVTPLIAALARQALVELNDEYDELFRSLRLSTVDRLTTLTYEGRYLLLTGALAGFGRAIAEVGAVMIVGGNIENVTRVMTTTIALETSKGNLSTALALGIVLIAISVVLNAAFLKTNAAAQRAAYA